MVRAPFQILVLPYRHSGAEVEYLVLHRSDSDIWQAVAGGGEHGENALQAAKRECMEELGFEGQDWIPLDTVSSIRKTLFKGNELWVDHPYVIPEYSFGMHLSSDPVLSHEHDNCRWVQYDEAQTLFTYDSNRTALWELNQRLCT
jgi:dATP pyrophosphohydrolase